MLASFRCSLTLNAVGVAFLSFVDDLRAGNEDSSSAHRAFISETEVRESAVSTVFRKVIRNRSRHSNASLTLGDISSELESKTVVSSRN